MTLTAYDYDKQTWVKGEAARLLLIQQANDSIQSLQSEGYRRMMGYSDSEASRLLANAREARRILSETEPRDPGDTEYARLNDVNYFRRKARKDADTRSVFAAQFTAHDALVDALRAFVGGD